MIFKFEVKIVKRYVHYFGPEFNFGIVNQSNKSQNVSFNTFTIKHNHIRDKWQTEKWK